MTGQPEVPDIWDRRIAAGLAFLRRRLAGDYEVDEFGFDPDLTEHVVHPPLRLLYHRWFRTELLGAEHLPRSGPALVVANHSGTVAMDAMMLAVGVHDVLRGSAGAGRHLRLLGADFVFRAPVMSELARKGGGTLACHPDAERLLRSGELVGVFPEGLKGVGKPYHERYKLQRFGRGGFVAAALRTGAPILPVGIVGAEEIFPKIGDIPLLPAARVAVLSGHPHLPVARPARDDPAAQQMADRGRGADRHHRLGRRGGRPAGRVQPGRPGPGDDPADPAPAPAAPPHPLPALTPPSRVDHGLLWASRPAGRAETP